MWILREKKSFVTNYTHFELREGSSFDLQLRDELHIYLPKGVRFRITCCSLRNEPSRRVTGHSTLPMLIPSVRPCIMVSKAYVPALGGRRDSGDIELQIE